MITTIEEAKKKQCRMVPPVVRREKAVIGGETGRMSVEFVTCSADECMQWSATGSKRGFCGLVHDKGVMVDQPS